jgi:hypothetical protein
VQDERLVPIGLDRLGELRLILSRVDMGVTVVLEDPEVAIQPHVHARRLDHLLVVRL